MSDATQSMIDQLNAFLPLAREIYEEAKIKHNADPARFPFEHLENIRQALAKVEAVAEKWNRARERAVSWGKG